VRAYLAANAHHLGQRLAAELPAFGYRVPEFGYLAWLDLRALGLDDAAIAQRLRDAGLGLNPGPSFGPGGAGFVRLNFGTPRALVDEGGGASVPGFWRKMSLLTRRLQHRAWNDWWTVRPGSGGDVAWEGSARN